MVRVGFDLDGVCIAFAETVWEFMVVSGLVTGPCPDVDDWYFYREEIWGSMEDAAFVQLCNDGVDAGIIFQHEEPLEGSVEAMNSVYASGHRVVIVTDRSFGSNQGKASRDATFSWLSKYGYQFHEIHFTADKCQVPLDTMIDDKTENFVALTEAGVDCYLLDKPWNQHCDAGDKRIYSMKEYLNRIAIDIPASVR